MKQKILVTGGAGYIGSHTVEALMNAGFDVVIIDDLSTGFKQLLNSKAKFYQLSVLDTEAVVNILISEKIVGVIHFAAKIIVPESILKPIDYYQNNTFGVLSILKACQKAKITNLVFSSTAAVYGNSGLSLLSEMAPIAPLNPYGFSKYFSEQMIRDAEIEYGLKSVILRYFNVAGASDNQSTGQLSKVATHLIKIASETACGKREKMFITGTDYKTFDGTGIRDYIHVEDLADIHVLSMKYLLNGGGSDLFNCGYGNGYSVREVINTLKKVSGVNFIAEEAPRRSGDADILVADSTKLRQKLQWTPLRSDLELICRSAYLFEKSLTSIN